MGARFTLRPRPIRGPHLCRRQRSAIPVASAWAAHRSQLKSSAKRVRHALYLLSFQNAHFSFLSFRSRRPQIEFFTYSIFIASQYACILLNVLISLELFFMFCYHHNHISISSKAFISFRTFFYRRCNAWIISSVQWLKISFHCTLFY